MGDMIPKVKEKPFNAQREKSSMKDRSGPQHSGGEHEAMRGSLRTANDFLEKQDSMEEYEVEGAYGRK